jgi:hypothetical protein
LDTAAHTSAPQAKVATSIRQLINDRLAAITPEQLVPPPLKHDDATIKGAHLVCTLNDEAKRLFILRRLLRNEGSALTAQGLALADEALKNMDKYKDLEPKMQELQRQVETANRVLEIVDNLFWAEVRQHSPELMAKQHVGVCDKDGEVMVFYEEDESLSSIHIVSMGGEMPNGLAELFAGSFGRRHRH